VTPSALTAAGFIRQIVALFGPQILEPLLLGPTAGPTGRPEVGEHGLLPLLEALLVHIPALPAVVVIAVHFDGVRQIRHMQQLTHSAESGRTAPSDRRVVFLQILLDVAVVVVRGHRLLFGQHLVSVVIRVVFDVRHRFHLYVFCGNCRPNWFS